VLLLSVESSSEAESELSLLGGLLMSCPRPDDICGGVDGAFPPPPPPHAAVSSDPAMISGRRRFGRNTTVCLRLPWEFDAA
jgi:hypothetical protein